MVVWVLMFGVLGYSRRLTSEGQRRGEESIAFTASYDTGNGGGDGGAASGGGDCYSILPVRRWIERVN